jgi:hypothetical protein
MYLIDIKRIQLKRKKYDISDRMCHYQGIYLPRLTLPSKDPACSLRQYSPQTNFLILSSTFGVLATPLIMGIKLRRPSAQIYLLNIAIKAVKKGFELVKLGAKTININRRISLYPIE